MTFFIFIFPRIDETEANKQFSIKNVSCFKNNVAIVAHRSHFISNPMWFLDVNAMFHLNVNIMYKEFQRRKCFALKCSHKISVDHVPSNTMIDLDRHKTRVWPKKDCNPHASTLYIVYIHIKPYYSITHSNLFRLNHINRKINNKSIETIEKMEKNNNKIRHSPFE